MKKLFAAAIIAASALSVTAFAGAGGIHGTLQKIDGSYYVIKDDAGKEHRFHFNDTSKKVGDVKEGAKVEVYVDKDHVNKIEVMGASHK